MESKVKVLPRRSEQEKRIRSLPLRKQTNKQTNRQTKQSAERGKMMSLMTSNGMEGCNCQREVARLMPTKGPIQKETWLETQSCKGIWLVLNNKLHCIQNPTWTMTVRLDGQGWHPW